MIYRDMTYMFLMSGDSYYFEQNWFFGEEYDDNCEPAVRLFLDNENDDRKLINCLTFDDLCGLKEVVDDVFENLCSRYNAKPDTVRELLERYPWLKEKAAINPLFGSNDEEDEEEDGKQ